MAAIQAGHVELLGLLFTRHSPKAFALCYRLVGNAEAADDLVQDAFLRVLRYRASFRAEARFTTWLYRIVRNVCMDYLKASSRAGELERQIAAQGDELDSAPAVDDSRLSVLRAALERLDPDKRELLIAARIDGLGYAQLAERFGASEGAIRVRVHRAMGELKRLVEALQEGES